jgi:hypothetical protein
MGMIETSTYAAIAERLGCSPEAARALAKRKRWHRTVGNDGKARVQIDLDEVNRPPVVPRASGGHAELLAQLETLRDELAKAERTRPVTGRTSSVSGSVATGLRPT